MIQVTIKFDARTRHPDHAATFPAVPRVGEFVEVKHGKYTIKRITHAIRDSQNPPHVWLEVE